MPLLKQLLNPLIVAYSARTPDHPGKWRVVNSLVRASGVDELNRGRDVVVRRRGILWHLDTECWVQRSVFYHGEWDGNEVRQLLAHFPRDGVFFDVGAYFGYYSLVVAHATRGAATVHAFEPVRANHALLVENCRLNGFGGIHPHPLALSDEPGTAEIELPPESNRGSGRVVAGDATGPHETVTLTTLDHFVAAHEIRRLDFVKIDVEGAELAVIRGARAALARFRPTLLVELNPAALRARQAEPVELLSLLRELGYSVAEVRAGGVRPFADSDLARDDLRDGYTNLFCRPTPPA